MLVKWVVCRCKSPDRPEHQVRCSDLAGVHSILPIAGGTVEHFVLQLDIGFSQSPVRSDIRWDRSQVALSSVSSLEIRLSLERYSGYIIDAEDRIGADVLQWLDEFLSSFTRQAQLQNMTIKLHGSSYCLQHLLHVTAGSPVIASLEKTIIDLPPKSVTFTTATRQNQRRCTLTKALLKRNFPAMYEQGIAKSVFPEGEIPIPYD